MATDGYKWLQMATDGCSISCSMWRHLSRAGDLQSCQQGESQQDTFVHYPAATASQFLGKEGAHIFQPMNTHVSNNYVSLYFFFTYFRIYQSWMWAWGSHHIGECPFLTKFHCLLSIIKGTWSTRKAEPDNAKATRIARIPKVSKRVEILCLRTMALKQGFWQILSQHNCVNTTFTADASLIPCNSKTFTKPPWHTGLFWHRAGLEEECLSHKVYESVNV